LGNEKVLEVCFLVKKFEFEEASFARSDQQ